MRDRETSTSNSSYDLKLKKPSEVCHEVKCVEPKLESCGLEVETSKMKRKKRKKGKKNMGSNLSCSLDESKSAVVQTETCPDHTVKHTKEVACVEPSQNLPSGLEEDKYKGKKKKKRRKGKKVTSVQVTDIDMVVEISSDKIDSLDETNEQPIRGMKNTESNLIESPDESNFAKLATESCPHYAVKHTEEVTCKETNLSLPSGLEECGGKDKEKKRKRKGKGKKDTFSVQVTDIDMAGEIHTDQIDSLNESNEQTTKGKKNKKSNMNSPDESNFANLPTESCPGHAAEHTVTCEEPSQNLHSGLEEDEDKEKKKKKKKKRKKKDTLAVQVKDTDMIAETVSDKISSLNDANDHPPSKTSPEATPLGHRSVDFPEHQQESSLLLGSLKDKHVILESSSEKPVVKYKYSKREQGREKRNKGSICISDLSDVSKSQLDASVMSEACSSWFRQDSQENIDLSGSINCEMQSDLERSENCHSSSPIKDLKHDSVSMQQSGKENQSSDAIKMEEVSATRIAFSDSAIPVDLGKETECRTNIKEGITGERSSNVKDKAPKNINGVAHDDITNLVSSNGTVSVEECNSMNNREGENDNTVGNIREQDDAMKKELMKVEKPLPLIRKKLLVLDLNGLLVDIQYVSNVSEIGIPYKRISGKSAFKRPFCDEFLDFCFNAFDIGIWSSRMRYNVDAVVDYIMGDRKHRLLFSWDQSKCTRTNYRTIENSHKPLVLKELSKLWDKEPALPWEEGAYSPSNTLLIDDSPYKAICNPPYTAIFPDPYSYENKQDKSLGPGGDIRMYLEGLATADSVQNYVKEHPFGQPSIREDHPSWNFYLQIIEEVKRGCLV